MLKPTDVLASSKRIGKKYANMMSLERKGRLAEYRLTRAAYARDLTRLLRETPPSMPKSRRSFSINIVRSWRICNAPHMYAEIERILTPDEWETVLGEVHPYRVNAGPLLAAEDIPE